MDDMNIGPDVEDNVVEDDVQTDEACTVDDVQSGSGHRMSERFAKLTDTVINVYDIITWCKLIQLF